MKWNSVKTLALITEPLPFLFQSSTFQFQTSKRARIRTRGPPKVSRIFCGDAWRQKAFQQCLRCATPKHVQIDEAYAEIVAKITEAATERETLRAPLCRPSKWWIGAQAWSALRSNRWHLLRAACVMFRSATRLGVADPSNVHEAADMFLLCQRATQWSKVNLVRASRGSNTLVTVDREAHFRSSLNRRKQRNTMEMSKFSTS